MAMLAMVWMPLRILFKGEKSDTAAQGKDFGTEWMNNRIESYLAENGKEVQVGAFVSK